ncbi:hypothetical protein [Christiangramia sabulilitoris]|uniref:DUF5004 domain-containing protein n=1 Tax=Christiangramia sabulilitoris TaxID=2583991 RepID=A0A550I612_9FLAO|nr:hypothetical protein [Christiangramia sabulilitoris]TRO66406.1 hypothetical protein FGM01_00550 [Christiangramia sabulilitoris]
MRRLKTIIVLLSLCISISCDTDRDDIELSEAEARELNLIVQQGEWKISNYTLNSADITANYVDYVFHFEDENSLLAISAAEEVAGTWRINNDSGDEFDSYNDVDFQIFFSSAGKLGELTNNYDVISATRDEIRLNLGANTTGTTANLVLIKN